MAAAELDVVLQLVVFEALVSRGQNGGAYIIEDYTDKQIERYPEEIDDSSAHLLGYMLASHLHHAGPEYAHCKLE